MNSKNIKKALNAKMNNWLSYVEDEKIKKLIKDNAIITGGAIVSMLTGEEVNDYDVYFKTETACVEIAKYYALKFNTTHKLKNIEVKNENGRVTCFIKSVGIVSEEGASPKSEDENNGVTDKTEPDITENITDLEKPSYRPVFFSTNAITLSDKIQLVIRFYGEPEEIHKNYDFVHCTCCYSFYDNVLTLPNKALEAIINKELFYAGSRYPVCSIIRTRKFISRGWTINAGQYLKMCLQVSKLNLNDLSIFKDQLAGVDSAYFEEAVRKIEKRKEEEPDFIIDDTYLFEVINRIF